MRHTLVVANRTASTGELLAEVERRAAQEPTRFTLLIPEARANWTPTEALAAMRRAARGERGVRTAHVEVRVTGADPFEAVREALAAETVDDVLISTLPKRRSLWLRRDLPKQVRTLGVPVHVVSAPAEPRIGLRDLPMGGPG